MNESVSRPYAISKYTALTDIQVNKHNYIALLYTDFYLELSETAHRNQQKCVQMRMLYCDDLY